MSVSEPKNEKCFWCNVNPRTLHTYVMEYNSPYENEGWKKLWTTESHCIECAKEDLYDRLGESCNTADSPQAYAEWNNSEYRVRKVNEE